MIGLVVVGVLFLAVACGAYNLASLAAENLADIRLPRVDIPLPDLGFRLPDWLTGDVAGQGALLEVAISDRDGLNLRDAPGLGSRVITLLPNGSRVRFLDGPKLVDNVPWVQVRARIDNRNIEGWVSASYVRQVPSDAGR
jgi:eukaryotic-like serine/threonine-protein kinase